MLAAYGTDFYNVVKVLHILCAIVGFGGVTLNSVYGLQAKKRGGVGAVAIGESVYVVSTIAEYFIYAVFGLGIVLALIGDNVFDFGQTWIWLSMVLYAIGIALVHGALRPRVRRMNALMVELANPGGPPAGASGPPPQALEIEALGKQVGMTQMVLDLMLVTILFLMVFKPGSPL